VYRGRKSPTLDGVYIYADYGNGSLFGLRYDEAAKKVTAHAVLLKQPDNVCSFAEDASGEVYTLMQSGKIYQIVAE